jgi:hypothetical protein
MLEDWERARATRVAELLTSGVPRKLGFEWLGEAPDEPEAPADLGIEWRWRMDRATWHARPSTE